MEMQNDIEVKGFQQKFENKEDAIRIGEARNTIDGSKYYVIQDTLRDEYFLEDQTPLIRKYEQVVWTS